MRILGTVAALLLGLIGLLMSLCGGGFTLMAVLSGDHSALGILVLSLPSLAAGMSLFWGALKVKDRADTTHDKPDDGR
jgi:hypothetical protein